MSSLVKDNMSAAAAMAAIRNNGKTTQASGRTAPSNKSERERREIHRQNSDWSDSETHSTEMPTADKQIYSGTFDKKVIEFTVSSYYQHVSMFRVCRLPLPLCVLLDLELPSSLRGLTSRTNSRSAHHRWLWAREKCGSVALQSSHRKCLPSRRSMARGLFSPRIRTSILT